MFFGFLGGVGISVIAVFVGWFLQKRLETRRGIEKAALDVYMKLLEIHSLYFWVFSGKLHRKTVDPEIKKRIRELSWQIADRLRAEDRTPFAIEILEVLMQIDYPSAKARYEEMDRIITEMGRKVNPRYAKAISKVSELNIRHLATTGKGRDLTPAIMD